MRGGGFSVTCSSTEDFFFVFAMNSPPPSSLPPWFSQFCAPDADRLSVLALVLHDSDIPFELVKTRGFRHLQVRLGRKPNPQAGEKVLIAHYDRVAASPGANDNGASVLALVDYLRRPSPGRRMRVVFTDGEELTQGMRGDQQGAFALAESWDRGRALFPVVFDMTGIGDTLVLGHLGQELVRQTRVPAGPTALDEYAKLRLRAKRWLATCGSGDALEVNAPFSDDLGFFLAGIPSVQVSVLPRKQALNYRHTRELPGEFSGNLPGELPPAWKTMHTVDDRPESLWPSARELMAEVLRKLEDFP